MAAGDLVVADWQVEIRTTLTGATTNYQLDSDHPIQGIGSPGAKTADVDLDGAAGSYGSADYTGPRVILIPYFMEGTPAAAGGYAKALAALWVPSTTDIPLYLQLPGYGKFHVNGRPRELDVDISLLRFGQVTALATFVALDPTITYP